MTTMCSITKKASLTMCNPDYELLMGEVECINRAYGWVGVLDALMYIQANEEEYKGTACYREFKQFMREGAKLFATKETA